MDTPLKKILYVEDEADIRAIAQIALVDIGGLTVKFCSSGQEAIHCATEFAPDLFLLDVMMPGLDGPATLAELRKISNLQTIPVIFMTARIQESEIAQYRKLDVLEILAKPFNPLTLADTLRQCWTKHHG